MKFVLDQRTNIVLTEGILGIIPIQCVDSICRARCRTEFLLHSDHHIANAVLYSHKLEALLDVRDLVTFDSDAYLDFTQNPSLAIREAMESEEPASREAVSQKLVRLDKQQMEDLAADKNHCAWLRMNRTLTQTTAVISSVLSTLRTGSTTDFANHFKIKDRGDTRARKKAKRMAKAAAKALATAVTPGSELLSQLEAQSVTARWLNPRTARISRAASSQAPKASGHAHFDMRRW
jgi:hypothetical protein